MAGKHMACGGGGEGAIYCGCERGSMGSCGSLPHFRTCDAGGPPAGFRSASAIDPRLQQLQSATDRAARGNRILVLLRPQGPGGGGLSCDQASSMDPQV